MVKEAEKYKLEDREKKKKMEAKLALKDYASNMVDTVSNILNLNEADKTQIVDAVETVVMSWLDENENKLAECENYENEMRKLENLCNSMWPKMN
ncbi:putative Heat shock protein 70kD [Rosa chinensis]|uniref:Putative Heat shock protein 70kD n=1 Tax=Rosa chinensis TaxID=74649 RepID=A0A2P6P7Y0_ROSCH|nr:putative Heat shock protein 70kD [Rosa chinensis]